jgi:iron complex outermembrane receptor protein
MQYLRGFSGSLLVPVFAAIFLAAGGVQPALAQHTVEGVVTEAETGEPLPGVNIQVQDEGTGTVSDEEGTFGLDVPSPDETLVFSFVGYEDQVVPLNGRNFLEIEMAVQALRGEEVVVVGYGTQERGEITGSQVSVAEAEFNEGNIESPSQLLQGQASGVSVTAQSGQPGAPQSVSIRGPSIRQGSEPLYVIDGMAIDNSADTDAAGGNFGPGVPLNTNPLAFLNPADIESIDVLKDATAAAIYGARASDGVILITTKGGEEGETNETRLNYTGSVTTANTMHEVDKLSAEEFAEFQESIGQGQRDQGAQSDFFDAITRTAVQTSHTLSYSTRTESGGNYRASVNWENKEGAIIENKLENFSGQLRADQSFIEDRLNLGANLVVSRQETDHVPIARTAATNLGDMLINSITVNPTRPVRLEDGSLNPIRTEEFNPVRGPKVINDFARTTRVLGQGEMSIELIDNLVWTGSFGLDWSKGNRRTQINSHNIPRLEAPNGGFSFGTRRNSQTEIESTVEYTRSIGENDVDFLGGYSYQRFLEQGKSFGGRSFTTTEVDAFRNPGIITDITEEDAPNGFSTKNTLQSFFGRVNYSYRDKYNATITLRADGSSRFGENNQYGYFPSFSLGWQVSEEPFLSDIDVLSDLNIRGGWGQTGNQQIPNGITQARLNILERRGYAIDGVDGGITPGISFERIQNEDLQWETSTQSNIGLDFGFFADRLYGTVEIWRDVTTDVLLETTTSTDPVAATRSFFSNSDMEITNRGIDVDISYRNEFESGFGFDVGGNISFLDSEIQDLPVTQILTGNLQGRGLSGEQVQALRNGLPIGAFWLFNFQGLDENGENKFQDVDGDGAITDNDKVFAGSAIADFEYGLSAEVSYERWTLSLNFHGKQGNDVYWNDQNARFNMPQLFAGNNIARVGFNPNEARDNSATASSRFLHDGSFLRLNDATLSYTFSPQMLPVNTVNLAATGRNLFLITDYPGFDPEVDTPVGAGGFKSFGIDNSRYPSTRSVTFQMDLTF